MSSLLVFSRRSNSQLTAQQRYGQPERGDLIDAQDSDVFHWGNMVMGPAALGWWQVVVVPNTRASDFAGLLSASPAEDTGWIRWRHRLWHIDLGALGRGQLAGGSWVVSREALMACAALKPDARMNAALTRGLVIG